MTSRDPMRAGDKNIADNSVLGDPPPPSAPLAPELIASGRGQGSPLADDGYESPARGSLKTDDQDQEEGGLSFKTFTESGLSSRILTSVRKMGWQSPTPIQSLCLPYSLKGMDVAGFAQTGTGKTAVFLLTVGHMVLESCRRDRQLKATHPLAIILAPTRELAIQIEEECVKLLGHLGVESAAVYGGSAWEDQAKRLESGVDVISATPGRLRDYLSRGLLSLEEVSLFICDEADRMFDMGFIEDVEYFLGKISKKAQKMVFSATTNRRVDDLVQRYLNDPEYILINPESVAPDRIRQHALICETPSKFRLLLWMLRSHKPQRAIIFVNTKLTALWLNHKLRANGISVDVITGDMAQNKRQRLISDIKEDKTNILIATDVASRGIHITGVTHVYNFDIPDEAANYIHRIGRTARAGAEGASYSILCEEYAANFQAVRELLGENCPECVWPNPDYMKVQDDSGNPFVDGLNFFAGPDSRGRSESQGEHRDGGAFERGPRSERAKRLGREPRQERFIPGARASRPERKERGQHPGRPGRHDYRDQDLDRRKRRHGQHGQKRSGDTRPPRREKQLVGKAAEAAAPQPRSVLGMFKKVIGILTGGGKK